MNYDLIAFDKLSETQLNRWSELQQQVSCIDNPSFCHEFAECVHDVQSNVEVVVARKGDGIVGFLPFQRSRNNVGLPVGTVLTEMHGMVAASDLDWNPFDLLESAGLVAWRFDHLVGTQQSFVPYINCMEDSPYMDLNEGYDAYLEDRKKAGCSTIKRAQSKARKLAREIGPLEVRVHDDSDVAFDAVIRWKRQQLEKMKWTDFFEQPWTIEVLRRIANVQNDQFQGLVSTLYAGDQLVGALIGMRSRHVISSWIPTFNPEYTKYSPGLLLHLELAKQSSQSGVTRIDLGRGQNQMKESLRSAGIPMGLGAIDRRPINRLMRHCWYRTRDIVHATPLSGFPLRFYRRVSGWLT